MRANPLLVAAVLLALLGGAVWYTRENPPEDDDAQPRVVDVEQAEIREVSLLRKGEDAITLVRGADDEWEFGGGSEIPADQSAVGQLVSSLASLNAERVVSENVVEWGPYELDEPELAVSFELAEGGGAVHFGRDTPTGSGVFARLEDDPRLFTLYSYNKTSFEKSQFDLRDKRLLVLDDASISSVTVSAGGRKLQFDRADGNWSIVLPAPLRADDFTVSDLVRAVRTAEMTEVLSDSADSPDYSFRSPLATVFVSDERGEHELVLAKDGETYYARSSAHSGVFGVSETLAESFDKPVSDFRNKKLFDFGFADPARVELQAGETSAAIVRGDDGWLLESDGNRELDGEKAQTLLDRLRNLTATEFPSDNEGRQKDFGLGSPAITAAVTPTGADGAAETVIVSKTDQTLVYAARVGEPSTYRVEQSAALDIERALEDLLALPDADDDSSESGAAAEDSES